MLSAPLQDMVSTCVPTNITRTVTGFCHALCTFIELYANQTVSPVMFHKVGSRRRRYEALPVGCPR